jgi:hypothetical protein
MIIIILSFPKPVGLAAAFAIGWHHQGMKKIEAVM